LKPIEGVSNKKSLTGETTHLTILLFALLINAAGCGGGKASSPSMESQFPTVTLDTNGIAGVRGAAALAELAQSTAATKLAEAWTSRITEQHVVDAIKTTVRAAGGDDDWCYPPIVATGTDALLPHGDFSNDGTHIVATGTIAIIDLAPRYRGYCADVARTYFIGPPTARMREAFAAETASLSAGIAAAAPGVTSSAMDGAIRAALAATGISGANMISIPGHGFSTTVHSGPLIYSGFHGALQQNVALALEPSITVDNSFRIQTEDDILITATGCERLTSAPEDIEDMIISP